MFQNSKFLNFSVYTTLLEPKQPISIKNFVHYGALQSRRAISGLFSFFWYTLYMSLYAFYLGQIISTVLGQVLTMAVKMVTLPKPESGTKRPKLTTPKNDAFVMVLSAKP